MIVAAATVPGAPLLLPGVTGGPVREVAKTREAMAAAVTALLDQGAEEIVVVGGAPATRPFPPDAPGPEQRVAPGWRRPHHDRRSAPDERRGGAGASPEVPGGPEERVAPGSPGRRWPGLDHRSAPDGRRGDEVLPEGAYSEVSEPGGESVPGPAGSGGRDGAGVAVEDLLPVSLAVGRSLLGGCPVPWTLRGVGRDESRDRCLELGLELREGGRPAGLLVVADGSARRSEKAPGHLDPSAIELDARIGAALTAADAGALLRLDPAACERALVAGRAAWQVMAAACEDRPWQAQVLYEEDPFGVAYWVITWT
ncbi:hypothetical protein AB0K05_11520 [Nonomuraea sp. NPDC049486]|uniref:hypothetical protein n=1 Tax=Nonomuraea sp. NPDC049486 TaxID=3155773 RepID=UPI003442FDAE